KRTDRSEHNSIGVLGGALLATPNALGVANDNLTREVTSIFGKKPASSSSGAIAISKTPPEASLSSCAISKTRNVFSSTETRCLSASAFKRETTLRGSWKLIL